MDDGVEAGDAGAGTALVGLSPVAGGVEAGPLSSSTPGAGGGGITAGFSGGAGTTPKTGVGLGVGAGSVFGPGSHPTSDRQTDTPANADIDFKIFFIPSYRRTTGVRLRPRADIEAISFPE